MLLIDFKQHKPNIRSVKQYKQKQEKGACSILKILTGENYPKTRRKLHLQPTFNFQKHSKNRQENVFCKCIVPSICLRTSPVLTNPCASKILILIIYSKLVFTSKTAISLSTTMKTTAAATPTTSTRPEESG